MEATMPHKIKSEANKRSVYLTEEIINEIKAEAKRQDRSVSWMLQRSWIIARTEIRNYEGMGKR
jgi:uncharacterized small protein (TIGR04563 family)